MRWILKTVNNSDIKGLVEALQISPLLARLLVIRGLTDPKVAYSFLNPSARDLHDPWLLKDMTKAVDYLIRAREENMPVLIYGDYDVDGITGTAILKEFLSEHGWKVDIYIPHRVDEGYGIQPSVVDSFCKKSRRLLLTVDCGTTAFEAISYVKSLGCPVVITDHHEAKEFLPPADAIVNPKRSDDEYPFKDLAGVGVAYKLICALGEKLNLNGHGEKCLDLVALGTIADMVDLTDENRYIVKEGLKRIGSSQRPGLSMLLERLSIKKPEAQDIGYRVAPKLNAAGRLGSAEDAFSLLTTDNFHDAVRLVDLLFEYNSARQEIEAEIFEQAARQIESLQLHKDPIIVVRGDSWHIGVIGIVATRLSHKYGKPVIVISENEDGVRGSGRSVPGVNLLECLQVFSEHFTEFGGHSMAIGLSMEKEKVDAFVDSVRKCEIPDQSENGYVEVDAEISLSQLNDKLFEDLDLLEPLGHGNPEPLFLVRKASVEHVRFFGNGQMNIRFQLRQGNTRFDALGFGLGHSVSKWNIDGTHVKADVIFSVRNRKTCANLNVACLMNSENGETSSRFSVGFSTKETQNFESEMTHRLSHLDLVVNNLFPGQSLILDLKSRNTLYYWLVDKFPKKCAFVSLNNALSLNIYQSLLRHLVAKRCGYMNSLSDSEKRFASKVFVTVTLFLEHCEKFLDKYDLIVLNEPSVFFAFEKDPQVGRFLEIVRKNPQKFVAVGVKHPPSMSEKLRDLGLEISYERSQRLGFGIIDTRGEVESVIDEVMAFVVSNQKTIAGLFKTLRARSENSIILIYTHAMNSVQRRGVVDQIKKRRLDKCIFSTNTDGLPTLLGTDVEIALIDVPLTLFEILDIFSLQESGHVLELCYDQREVSAKRNELRLLFPTEDQIAKLAFEIKVKDSLSVREFTEYLLQEGHIKSPSYAKIFLSAFKNMGARVIEDRIYLNGLNPQKTPLRCLEGELEIRYFNQITMPILVRGVRSIYKTLSSAEKVV